MASQVVFHFQGATGTRVQMVWENVSLADGQWHFVYLLVNHPTVLLVVDGVRYLPVRAVAGGVTGARSTLPFALADGAGKLFLGARFDELLGASLFFRGQMAGLALHTGPAVLAAAEATAVSACMWGCAEVLTLAGAVPAGLTVTRTGNQLAVAGPAAVAVYQALLATATLAVSATHPQVASRTVRVTLNDGVFSSAATSVAVTLVAGARRRAEPPVAALAEASRAGVSANVVSLAVLVVLVAAVVGGAIWTRQRRAGRRVAGASLAV